MALIGPDDVERAFDRTAILKLARVAKLPPDADLPRFGDDVRIAVRIFLEAKKRLNAPRLRDVIAQLYRLNTRAERGTDQTAQALAHAVDEMPADVRRWLASVHHRHGRDIPTSADILSPQTRQRAVERLRVILSSGGRIVVGRKQMSGRRSRTFKPLLRAPTKIERGRPAAAAEREFVHWLGAACRMAGKPLPHTASDNPDIRGPFPQFVRQCFELVGLPTGNVGHLINQYGTALRWAERRND